MNHDMDIESAGGFDFGDINPQMYPETLPVAVSPVAAVYTQLGSPGLVDATSELAEISTDEIHQFLTAFSEANLEMEPVTGDIIDLDDSPYLGQLQKLEVVACNADNLIINLQIQQYSSDFHASLTLRRVFANFIERKHWNMIQCDADTSPIHISAAKAIVLQLNSEVGQYLRDVNNTRASVEERNNLQRWLTQSTNYYLHNPLEFVKVMQKMMKKEQSILQMANEQRRQSLIELANEPAASPSSQHSINHNPETSTPLHASGGVQRILGTIANLELSLNDVSGRLEQLMTEIRNLLLYLPGGDIKAIVPERVHQIVRDEDKERWKSMCLARDSIVNERKRLIYDYHKDRFAQQFNFMVDMVLGEIVSWKRSEAFAMNGKRFNSSPDIDQLEDCFKPLGQLLTDAIAQLVKLRQCKAASDIEERQNAEIVNHLVRHYQKLFERLVKESLVIDKHPSQVLMKEKKFSFELRHLMGDSLPQTQFETTVELINAEMACTVVEQGPTTKITPAGTIQKHRVKSLTNTDTRQVHIRMTNMSLGMRQRGGDRARAEAVAEEKFCMIFRAHIPVTFPSNDRVTVIAQTFSLPIVVISHGKQEAEAKATVFWDNAYHDTGRRPFTVPDMIPWSSLLTDLDLLWRKYCENESGIPSVTQGIGLTAEAKKYLTAKLFGTDNVTPNTPVSWKQFSRDHLAGKDYSFWTWFYKAMELVSSPYVKRFWNLGYIVGFISRADCQAKLSQCQPGTFMYRFSDSLLGHVSISVYTFCNNTQTYEVVSLEPDSINNFRRQRSLPGIVYDLDYLKYLYPNDPKDLTKDLYPKDLAFGPYYSGDWSKETSGLNKNYVPKRVKITTDQSGGEVMMNPPRRTESH